MIERMIKEGKPIGANLIEDYAAQTGKAVPKLVSNDSLEVNPVASTDGIIERTTAVTDPTHGLQRPQCLDVTPIFVSAALDELGLSASAFRVYANLARRADKDTRCCYPARGNIAQICRLHRDTVDACLKELLARGMVVKKRKFGHVSTYRIMERNEWCEVIGKKGLTPKSRLLESKGQELTESEGQDLPETKGHKGNPGRVSKEGHTKKVAMMVSSSPTDHFNGLPEILNTAPFKKAWAEWLTYRNEAKLRVLKPASIRERWLEMESWGQVAAIEAIKVWACLDKVDTNLGGFDVV